MLVSIAESGPEGDRIDGARLMLFVPRVECLPTFLFDIEQRNAVLFGRALVLSDRREILMMRLKIFWRTGCLRFLSPLSSPAMSDAFA